MQTHWVCVEFFGVRINHTSPLDTQVETCALPLLCSRFLMIVLYDARVGDVPWGTLASGQVGEAETAGLQGALYRIRARIQMEVVFWL